MAWDIINVNSPPYIIMNKPYRGWRPPCGCLAKKGAPRRIADHPFLGGKSNVNVQVDYPLPSTSKQSTHQVTNLTTSTT
jgi:hypothetical protein